jgi:hypothetical protein
MELEMPPVHPVCRKLFLLFEYLSLKLKFKPSTLASVYHTADLVLN